MRFTSYIFNLLLTILCSNSLDIGDECRLRDNSFGVCELRRNCEFAQNNFNRFMRHNSCGWDGFEQIVCCDKRSISEKKCLEYTQLDVMALMKRTKQSQFIGSKISFLEFSHMALLGYGSAENRKYECGGSLISEEFVLTAAHCLESFNFGPLSAVILGELDTSTEDDKTEPQQFSVVKTFEHPDFDFAKASNDIALIKLDRPAIFTTYVRPACLQTEYDFGHNEDLLATGWGALHSGGSMHNYLQKVVLNNLPLKYCSRKSNSQLELNGTTQICSGIVGGGRDTCRGDSGGPLQIKYKDFPLTYKIVGVTSYGSHCGYVPAVYTRVSHYIPWIESIVWPN